MGDGLWECGSICQSLSMGGKSDLQRQNGNVSGAGADEARGRQEEQREKEKAFFIQRTLLFSGAQ